MKTLGARLRTTRRVRTDGSKGRRGGGGRGDDDDDDRPRGGPNGGGPPLTRGVRWNSALPFHASLRNFHKKSKKSRGSGTSSTAVGSDASIRCDGGESCDVVVETEPRSTVARGVEMTLSSVRGRTDDAFARRVFEVELARHVEEYFARDGDGGGGRELTGGAVRGLAVTVEVESAELVLSSTSSTSTEGEEPSKEGPPGRGSSADAAAARRSVAELLNEAKSGRDVPLADVRVVYTQMCQYAVVDGYDAQRVLVEGAFGDERARASFGSRLRRPIPGRTGAFESVGSVGVPKLVGECDERSLLKTEAS